MHVAFTILLALLFTATPVLASPKGDCSSPLSGFLAHPDAARFHALVRKPSCAVALTDDNAALQQLQKRVTQGNLWAARYLARTLPGLDGGNLEDGLLALGQFADKHPDALLNMVHQGELSLRSMTEALIMHPASLTDDRKATLVGLQRRLRLIYKVHQEALRFEQAEAAQALQQAIANIRQEVP